MLHGGRLCRGDGHGIGWPHSLFYVCPRTGILKNNPRRCRHVGWVAKLPVRFLGNGAALVRKDGAWYIITAQKFPEYVWVRGIGHAPAIHAQTWDALLKRKLHRAQAVLIYGRPIHAAAARRAGKREVRGIVNSYPLTNRVR
jgi:hypothetical protein